MNILRQYKKVLFAALVACALHSPARAEEQKNLRVFFVLEGKIKGQGIGDADQAEARTRTQITLTRALRKVLALDVVDPTLLESVKNDAQKMAILRGGSAADVRKALAEHEVAAFVRVTYRTAPVVNVDGMFRGVAALVMEMIDLKSAEKALIIESQPMGTPDCGPDMVAQKGATIYNAGFQAVTAAAADLVKKFENHAAVQRLREGKPLVEPAPVDPKLDTKKKVLFIIEGNVNGQYIQTSADGKAELRGEAMDETDFQLAARRLEATLYRKMADVLKITNFDKDTLDKLKEDQKKWAILRGGSVGEVKQAVAGMNVDQVIRINYRTEPMTALKSGELLMYSGLATMSGFFIDQRTGKMVDLMTPLMGTNEHPAKRAIDPFNSGLSALDYASDLLIDDLKEQLGLGVLKMDTNDNVVDDPNKPTVAVIWIRPSAEFKPWHTPRASNPALGMKKRKQVAEFVKYMRETGDIGVDVSDYLVKGLSDSGVFIPIEESQKIRGQIAEVKNQLLEYRKLGWVGEKLPFDSPVTAAGKIQADYAVTATIDKIHEESSSTSLILVSKGSLKSVAEATVVVTNVKTGQSKSFKGTGSLSLSGYGTVYSFEPGAMKLDKLLIGQAIKEALYNAAKQATL
jgi:hypothetical protein